MIYIEDLLQKSKTRDLKIEEPIVTRDAGFFEGEVQFEYCNFRELKLYGNVFSSDVTFKNCKIGQFHLTSCSFNGKLNFINCVFQKEFVFDSCNFEELVTFRKNEFLDGINIFGKGEEGVGYVEFNGGLLIYS